MKKFPQPHQVTVVTPAVTADRRGSQTLSYADDAGRITVPGWVQQIVGLRGAEEALSDRDVRTSRWTLFSDSTPTLTALDRLEWNGMTFVCEGQPNHLDTPRGYHHTEANLKLVEG